MPQKNYAGRHRGQVAGSGDPSAALRRDVSPVAVSGRHRAPGSPSIPRLAGTGVLLPTAATATIVLTTTGAHLGGVPAPAAVVAPPAAVATAGIDAARASEQADLLDSKSRLLSVQLRASSDRAARSAPRAPAPPPKPDPAAVARAAAAAKAAKAAKAAAQLAAVHRWVTPLDVRYTLTSGFAMRWGVMHPGQDFGVPVGSPLKAMSSGTVIFAGWAGGYGNKVEIRYWDGTISWYAHNSRLQVTRGETVTPGEVVALSGNTGHSTGPHSHIEIHLGGDDTPGSAVPPIPWFNAHGNFPGRGVVGSPTASD